MKKIFLLLTVLLCFTVGLSAKSVFDSADDATKATLKEIDDLLDQQQFESAFGKTSDTDNEYMLAKRVEIAINGFAQSIMHQMFAFKNLRENETLYDVRTGTGEYSLIMFDPVKAIESFEKEHGEKAILKYSLGLYYQDVIDRYGDQWLLTTEQLVNKIIENLSNALNMGCYDDYSLSVLATSFYQRKELDNAIEIYQLKQKEFEFTPTDNYHYGILLWFTNNAKEGLEYAVKSIDGYKDEPAFQLDAYIVSARIALDISDLKSAEKYLSECKKKYPEDYRIYQYSVALYSLQNNKKKTLDSAMKIFEYGTANPATCQMVMDECNGADKPEFAIEFFNTALKKYSKDDKALQNLYFHYAYQLYLMQEKEQAAEMAEKARSYFDKNGELTENIENMLNTLAGKIN